MKSLWNTLRARGANEPVIFTPGQVFTVRDLGEIVAGVRAQVLETAVRVRAGSPLASVLALLSLDGYVSELELMPAGESRPSDGKEEYDADSLLSLVNSGVREMMHCQDASLTEWALYTSGTSGVPKRIVHTLGTLSTHVKPRAGCSDVWALMYDPFRMAGIQVVLQAFLGGGALAVPVGSDFDAIVQLFNALPITAASGTPSLWRKLLIAGIKDSGVLISVTLGGEIADQAILDAIKVAFPRARVRHIYASTEFGVGFSVVDGIAGFPLDWLRTGVKGVELCVIDGELFLKRSGGAWQESGDLVRVDNECGRVFFLGRANQSINVGGNKVMPETVEAVVASVSGVVDCLAYGISSSILGTLVAVEVVAVDFDLAVLRQRIKEECKSRLAAWQRPARLTFVREIAVNANGKKVRR